MSTSSGSDIAWSVGSCGGSSQFETVINMPANVAVKNALLRVIIMRDPVLGRLRCGRIQPKMSMTKTRLLRTKLLNVKRVHRFTT